MAINLETISGDDLAAFKNALTAIGYPVALSTTSISSPVNFVDVSFPDGYDQLFLAIDGLQLTAGSWDTILFQFSSDGGSTWDTAGNYTSQLVRGSGTSGGTGTLDTIGFPTDTSGHLANPSVADVSIDANAFFSSKCWLHLGVPTVVNFGSVFNSTTNGSELSVGILTINSGGVWYVGSRPNAMRISTFVGGDMMSAGQFRLTGFPSLS